MQLNIPDLSLVVLVGASGSGKSTFARRHFRPSEVLSSDEMRERVADDPNDQAASAAAFAVLHLLAAKRLELRRLAVVDATNVLAEGRKQLLDIARRHHVLPVALVFDLPERLCQERNGLRDGRRLPPHAIRDQVRDLRRSVRTLEREGFRLVHVLRTPEEVAAAEVVRQPLWTDKRQETGPFDIVGDVHGCIDELRALMAALGYDADGRNAAGRRLVFLGDLVDRGPGVVEVLRLVMGLVAEGRALCVPGNHEVKLLKKLQGRDVKVGHGLAESLRQLELEPEAFRGQVREFITRLVSHYVLDGGRLVVAHAGLKAELQGRASSAVREFALYGETTGETDAYGLPVRYDWATDYRGPAMVVYGHTPVPEAEWLNHTVCIDTGCVFGGKLTALRYPERELVSVPAARVYYEPARPLAAAASGARTAQQERDDLLDLEDVVGRRFVRTRWSVTVPVAAENAAAALEVMSRFAVDPRWIVHLPPTMSAPETSPREGLLEHPDEAFAWYRKHGATTVVCQEKHMGSRAVVVVCRDQDAARRRFGVLSGDGKLMTRTGRAFFSDAALEAALLAELRAALGAAGWWERFASDWFCLDCELMPWSVKAQELLRGQYAAVGAAATAALDAAASALSSAPAPELLARVRARAAAAQAYGQAWRRYAWPVQGVGDLRLAPFHVLASEGKVHADQDHLWHMETIAALVAARPGVLWPTRWTRVELGDDASVAGGVRFWEELTAAGGEGMVVKPREYAARGRKGLLQPAIKCRGPEYLRIIYGPEYSLPEHLERLRARGVSAKRQLAIREFALGLEALQRFVDREPLRRVHECVFAVLALESEPVDPRL